MVELNVNTFPKMKQSPPRQRIQMYLIVTLSFLVLAYIFVMTAVQRQQQQQPNEASMMVGMSNASSLRTP